MINKDYSNIERNLQELTQNNRTFDKVVARFFEQRINPRPASRSTQKDMKVKKGSVKLSTIRNAQELSKRLYDILRMNGNCHCHGLSLRLEFDISAHRDAGSPMQQSFRLLAALRIGQQQYQTVMDIDDSPTILNETLQALEVRAKRYARPRPSKTSGLSSPKSTMPISILDAQNQPPVNPASKLKKRVGLLNDIPKNIGKRPQVNSPPSCSTATPAQRRRVNGDSGIPSLKTAWNKLLDTPMGSQTTISTTTTQLSENLDLSPNIPEIDNLCSCLAQLNSGPSSNRENCFGYIPGSEDYRYLFFPSPSYFVAPNRSLFQLLESTRKSDRMTVRERLEMAFILAISLLQLQSAPWFKRKFRSRDFVLLSGGESTPRWLPHIAVTFDPEHKTIEQGTSSSHKPVIRNTPIFSLGVVLLELSLSEPLCYTPKSYYSDQFGHGPNNNVLMNPELSERLEATKQVFEKSVSSEMGPAYQRVVRKCVFWDKEEEELSKTEVQEVFYEEVVCMLDHALWVYDGCSHLGIQWE